MKRAHWLYLAEAVCGAAIWILIAPVSGRNEAWDSNLYFSVGIPAVCLVSMALAFFEPSEPWRWGVLPMVGQFVWMLISPRQSIASWSDSVRSAVGPIDHCGSNRRVHCHENS